MQIGTSVTVEDLKKAAKLVNSTFYGIPISEKELTNQQKVEKYHQLLDLSDFMKTFGETRNEISQYKIFNNKVALDKISRKSRKDGQLPLEYSSDEDFDY